MQAVLSNFNVSRLSRLLPWLGAAILIAGVVVYLYNRETHISARQSAVDKASIAGYKAPPKLKELPLESSARLTAGKFVIDAVQRKNLAAAWNLVAPEMKAGITHKQWMTGDIPIVPFPDALSSAPLKIDISRPKTALLEVALVPKNAKASTAGGVFWLNMRKIGTGKAGHWAVVSWVPRYAPPIPSNPGN